MNLYQRERLRKYILLSMFLVVLLFVLILASYTIYQFLGNRKYSGEDYRLKKIIAKTSSTYELPLDHLEGFLGLEDKVYYGEFNGTELSEKLRSSPVVASAEVRIVKPDIIFIKYSCFEPLAYVLDIDNSAIDSTGTIFPVYPYYTPKKIPELFLGISDILEWKDKLNGAKIDLALYILSFLSQEDDYSDVDILALDVSGLSSSLAAERQIILKLLVDDKINILRLDANNYLKGLGHYLSIRSHLTKLNYSNITIDLRFDEMAFVMGRYE